MKRSSTAEFLTLTMSNVLFENLINLARIKGALSGLR